MKSIGIVDDNPTALAQMRFLLERVGFDDIRAHADPQRALDDFRRSAPGVILVDYMMPGIDGVQFLEELRRKGDVPPTPSAVVTGYATLDDVRLPAFRAGALQVISKPIKAEEFAITVRNLERLGTVPLASRPGGNFQALRVPRVGAGAQPRGTQTLLDKEVERMLVKVASIHDENTGFHLQRMAHYTKAIALHYGLGPIEQSRLFGAAPLHDIGKIGIDTRLLHKPSPLTADERTQVERHTLIGHEILHGVSSPLLQLGATIALSHHERWDGTGYPNRLRGEAIPLPGRIVALADVFDALTSVRPYKQAWLVEKAATAIQSESGRHFDPAVVRAFMSALETCRHIRRHFDGDVVRPHEVPVLADEVPVLADEVRLH